MSNSNEKKKVVPILSNNNNNIFENMKAWSNKTGWKYCHSSTDNRVTAQFCLVWYNHLSLVSVIKWMWL